MDYDDDFNDDFESQFADHEEMLRELEAEKHGNINNGASKRPDTIRPKENPENVYDSVAEQSADLNTSNEADLRKKRRFETNYESLELDELSLNEDKEFAEFEKSEI